MNEDGRGVYYDRDGQPISPERFVELCCTSEYRRVAETATGAAWISTVWLGVNHNFSGDGPPLIFETMIFPECGYCVRTPTQAAALAAHDQAVAHVTSGAYAAECRQTETPWGRMR